MCNKFIFCEEKSLIGKKNYNIKFAMKMATFIPEFCTAHKCRGYFNNGFWNCDKCNIINGYQYPSNGYYDSYYGDTVFGAGDYYNNWSGCLQVIHENDGTGELDYIHGNVTVNFAI